MYICYMAISLFVGIYFKSTVFVILNALTCVVATSMCSKGIIFGNIVGIVNMLLYITSCFFNKFYGEILTGFTIAIPAYAFSFYSWMKSRKSGSEILSVNKVLSAMEWVLLLCCSCGVGVGLYYLLDVFGTANLIISTISTVLNFIAAYLQIRRSELNFFMYVISGIICIVLWLSTIKTASFANLPIVIAYFVLVSLNSYGLINWIKLKKLQSEDNFDKIIKICKSK